MGGGGWGKRAVKEKGKKERIQARREAMGGNQCERSAVAGPP